MDNEQATTEPIMTFDEALKFLNIEDYKDRIFNSNSHGELFHLREYIILAELNKENPHIELFRPWFELVVEKANEKWARPASIYQHMLKIFTEHAEHVVIKHVLKNMA